MFVYEKKLQYPINIRQTNPKLAKIIISQYGGPDGELGASLEELGHLEMVGTIVYQLTKNLSIEEIKAAGLDQYFVDHTAGIYPASASGVPYSAAAMQVKGDIIADIHEDLAAEQKARVTYDNILRFCDDPEVIDPIRFLRQREIVHYQRFGEALRIITDKLDSKNFYSFNPEFDKGSRR